MASPKTFVALVGLLLAACGPGLLCDGPQDCSGNACCYVRYTLRSAGDYVSCTNSPSACSEKDTVDMEKRRLCLVDDDCTAGGITTPYTKCCRASVLSSAAKTCTSPGLCVAY